MQNSTNLTNSDVKVFNSFWRSRSLHSTAQTSPNKAYKKIFNCSRASTEENENEISIDFAKKSIYDVKYYMQVYKKKMRGALISKNFEESNTNTELSQSSSNRGLKGGKVQNKNGFRKNKFVKVDKVGCVEPEDQISSSNLGLIARHQKPNLMYNLNLFRKKYTKHSVSLKNSTDNLNIYQESSFPHCHSQTNTKLAITKNRRLKTESKSYESRRPLSRSFFN